MERNYLTNKNKCLPAGRQGFTLLELLIVISIIGILISISVVSYGAAQKKSRDSRRMSDLKAVQSGFEQYYADNSGSYPDGCDPGPGVKYLPAGLPTDPQTNASYPASCGTTAYCICATLESTLGNAKGTNCSYETGQAADTYFCVSNLQ